MRTVTWINLILQNIDSRVPRRTQNQFILCRTVRVQKRANLEKKIDKILLKRAIEPAEVKWTAPIEFAVKKDGSLRFCIHY